MTIYDVSLTVLLATPAYMLRPWLPKMLHVVLASWKYVTWDETSSRLPMCPAPASSRPFEGPSPDSSKPCMRRALFGTSVSSSCDFHLKCLFPEEEGVFGRLRSVGDSGFENFRRGESCLLLPSRSLRDRALNSSLLPWFLLAGSDGKSSLCLPRGGLLSGIDISCWCEPASTWRFGSAIAYSATNYIAWIAKIVLSRHDISTKSFILARLGILMATHMNTWLTCLSERDHTPLC